jgi:hypothetical protein
MSDLTLAQLLATEPAPFHTAGQTWAAVATDMDRAADDLIRSTRDLEDAWPVGAAAEAGRDATRRLRTKIADAYEPAQRLSDVVETFAHAVAELREQAHGILDRARQGGFAVDTATGAVTPPPVPATPAAHHDPDLAQVIASQRTQAAAYAAHLAEVLGRARALDDRTATELTRTLPGPESGFVSGPPVTREDLEALRDRSPRAVHDYWNGLGRVQQLQAIARHPDLVGWLDGVPAADRDAANRITLDRELASFRGREQDLQERLDAVRALPSGGRGTGAAAGAVLRELDEVRDGIGELETIQERIGRPDGGRLLMGLDTEGDGKAIVAIGNPDAAAHVGVWVGGVGSSFDSVVNDIHRAVTLQTTADRMTPSVAGDVATVMYLGYDAPEMDLSAALDNRAKDGAESLDRFVDGVHATNQTAEGPHLTAIGHSYGSVMVATAVRDEGLAVTDMITAGSPGLGVDNVRGLDIDPRHVWVGTAPDDPVSNPHGYADTLPRWIRGDVHNVADLYEHGHGPNPHDPAFGANRYHVDTSGHSDYFENDSLSLFNQAAVLVGQYDVVLLEHGTVPR